ncbi:MAG TPA: SAM-dependent methyltransferase [Polyangiales bacterium]|nr:SAM-dependent methyltransferase [Polyangiales bacterium]
MTRTTWLQALTAVGSIALASCGGSSEPPAAEQSTGQENEPVPPIAAPTPEPAPPAPVAGTPSVAEPAQPVQPAITPVDPATAPQPVAIKVPKNVQTLIDAKDRTDADRALDAGRHPGETVAFAGVKPGMKIADIMSGTGYTTELLARAVGKKGVVYAQNNKFIVEKFAAAPWAERLARPANKNVVRVDRELEDPLPPEAKDLDAVFNVLIYHDLFWSKVDRAKMNAAIFAALKPGGAYVVIDHSGRTGSGSSEVMTLHRIEESTVRADIEAAGFKLESEGQFLRNPQDTRDWNDSPMAAKERRGSSDRFVLKFVKPK